MIAHETGVVNGIDPLGGSYHVEALTNRLEAEAYELFRRIDELGGMVAAIEQNMPQREIAEAAYRYQQEVESGERVVVGVNRYRTEDDEEIHILRIDPDLERKQIERLDGLQGAPRLGGRRAPARGALGGGLDARPQPDAGDRRRRPRRRHPRRDLRRLAPRLGHLARAAGVLARR